MNANSITKITSWLCNCVGQNWGHANLYVDILYIILFFVSLQGRVSKSPYGGVGTYPPTRASSHANNHHSTKDSEVNSTTSLLTTESLVLWWLLLVREQARVAYSAYHASMELELFISYHFTMRHPVNYPFFCLRLIDHVFFIGKGQQVPLRWGGHLPAHSGLLSCQQSSKHRRSIGGQ